MQGKMAAHSHLMGITKLTTQILSVDVDQIFLTYESSKLPVLHIALFHFADHKESSILFECRVLGELELKQIKVCLHIHIHMHIHIHIHIHIPCIGVVATLESCSEISVAWKAEVSPTKSNEEMQ